MTWTSGRLRDERKIPVTSLEGLKDVHEFLGLGSIHGERLYEDDGVLLGLVGKSRVTGESLLLLVELEPVEARLGSEDTAAADEDVRLEAAMTGAAAALLAAKLLCGVSDFAAVLGLGGSLTPVGEVLDNVKIDGMVVGLDAENLLVKDNLLAGISSVYFQYWQFHN